MNQKQLYIGLMSGTSVDSIDAAAMQLENGVGHILGTYSLPIPNVVRNSVFSLGVLQKMVCVHFHRFL